MTREERIEKYGSFLYCPKRDTLCFGHDYDGNGECMKKSCILDDPEYQAQQERIKQRQQELCDRHNRRREDETETAENIRRQNKTSRDRLLMEIEKTREKMERDYRMGRTRSADKLSFKLAEMERRLKA